MKAAAVLLASVALVLSGCGATPGPGEVVIRYRETLARDPIRSLELLTDDFHRRHALRFHEVGDLPPAAGERRSTPGTGAEDALPTSDPDLELERARLGWLTVLTRPAFRNHGPDLAIALAGVERDGDAARVDARVRLREQPGFRVEFALRRDDAGAWRIDAIEIPDERGVHVVPAYLIAPTAERHRRLEAWRSSR